MSYYHNGKIYWKDQNEQIKLYYKCICGSYIKKKGKIKHERSKKHMNYINNK